MDIMEAERFLKGVGFYSKQFVYGVSINFGLSLYSCRFLLAVVVIAVYFFHHLDA